MSSSLPPSPIRAIVSRFSFGFSHKVIEEVLQKRPFEYCGILSNGEYKKFYDAIPLESQEWFFTGDMRGCKYDGVDFASLLPVDEELLEGMHEGEVLFMDIVARLEWKAPISFAVRKQWYLQHVRFWNDYLERKRINLYLAAWLPHEIPDVVIYHLCKVKGIPILYFHMSTERDTAFLEHDMHRPAEQIGPRYEQLLKEFAATKNPEEIPLSPRFAERYRALTALQGEKPPLESLKKVTYFDRVWQLLRTNNLAFFRFGLSYCSPKGIVRALGAWRRWRDIRARNAFYAAHAIEPDLQKTFVYMALHFQPEASTVPLAGAFANQLLIAQMLNALLPDGVLLYVKEHPKESSWLSRSIGYYQELLALPRVRLVARHVDTFLLREHCIAVATATGSVGFEALFRKKPVFLFGNRFYQYAKGVFRIRTLEDMRHAIDAVFTKHTAPTLCESRLYLKAMEDTCIWGVLNPWDYMVSHLPEEAHVNANTVAILDELERMDESIAKVTIS